MEANLQNLRLKSQQPLIGLTLLLSHTQKHTHVDKIKKVQKYARKVTVKLRLKMALKTKHFCGN